MENNVKLIKSDKLDEFKETVMKKKFSVAAVGEWSVLQDILQEIIAQDVILSCGDESKETDLKHLHMGMIAAIQNRFADDLEFMDYLISSVPTYQTAWRWASIKGWDEAVEAKIRSCKVFRPGKKYAMLEALYEKGKIKGDVRAMELYFKLAGDLSTEKNKGSKELDDYRDFNRILHTPRTK